MLASNDKRAVGFSLVRFFFVVIVVVVVDVIGKSGLQLSESIVKEAKIAYTHKYRVEIGKGGETN